MKDSGRIGVAKGSCKIHRFAILGIFHLFVVFAGHRTDVIDRFLVGGDLSNATHQILSCIVSRQTQFDIVVEHVEQ